MTRENYKPIAYRLEQVAALLKPAGVTRQAISDGIGVATKSAMNYIMLAAVEAGVAFRGTARVSDDKKTPESIYFPTAADRDAFMAAYTAQRLARRKEAQREKALRNYKRNRAAINAARIKQRAAARAEQMKERARLDKEAHAADRQREKAEAASLKARLKAEAASLKARLKAETKAAGKLAPLKGTASPKPAPVRGPAHLAGPADVSRARVTVYSPPPARFAPAEVPSLFGALKPGQYIAPAAKWAEAVAA